MTRLMHSITVSLMLTTIIFTGCSTVPLSTAPQEDAVFSFIAAADMRQFAGPKYQSSEYFLGTCEAIKDVGKGAFMVCPGDIDPPQHVVATAQKVLGEDYPCYLVVGNHESETPEDMAWLRNWGKQDIPNLVRRGPKNCEETTYSFDYKNAHFAVINQYYDGKSDTGTNGDVTDPLYEWLKNDLEQNSKPMVFVLGHEPMLSIPDYDNGRHRHRDDCLDAHPKNNQRFQQLLRKHNVTAYICGHTHDFSSAKLNGIWQLDVGHCRGIGDKGAQSTFLVIKVGENSCWTEVYRDDAKGGKYNLTQTIPLN